MDLLRGAVQPYAWGDTDAIATIQRRAPSGQPEAELWFGAHPIAPSHLVAEDRSLLDAVAARPGAILGGEVAERFGGFPYLLKVLAAAEPLSIQAHPSLQQAKAGYEREHAAGVPLDAPDRTYRDENHKPELLCALTPFEAKCGFRSPEAAAATLTRLVAGRGVGPAIDGRGTALVEELCGLLVAGPPERSIAESLGWLFHLRPDDVTAIVGRVVEGAALLVGAQSTPPGDESPLDDTAELRWVGALDRHHPNDVGIVVSLLLNHVTLAPGEAMYLGAGNLHAYLRGVGVELMANSDNVVRGGLTVKHVDVDELLAIVDCRPGPPPVQRPSTGDHRYHSPTADFSLTRLVGAERVRCFDPIGPEIVLVTEGRADLRPATSAAGRPDSPLVVAQGSAALVGPGDGPYEVRLGDGTVAWRATVGALADDCRSE